MYNIEEVNGCVLELMEKESDRLGLGLDDTVELASIQILKILAAVEKKFLIEVDDRYIFHGLFTSPKVLSSYICNELGLAQDNTWKNACG